jgi:hypothetical protein
MSIKTDLNAVMQHLPCPRYRKNIIEQLCPKRSMQFLVGLKLSEKTFSLLLIAITCLATNQSHAGILEIADPNLPDIAMVTTLSNGRPVVIYNPILCNQVGPLLCGFFRAHEHCHVELGHTIRHTWPQQKEFEADCCAARNISQAQLNAAYQWFVSGRGGSPIHGLGYQRAARIHACSR